MIIEALIQHLQDIGYHAIKSTYRSDIVIVGQARRNQRPGAARSLHSITMRVDEDTSIVTLVGPGPLELAEPDAIERLERTIRNYFDCHPLAGITLQQPESRRNRHSVSCRRPR